MSRCLRGYKSQKPRVPIVLRRRSINRRAVGSLEAGIPPPQSVGCEPWHGAALRVLGGASSARWLRARYVCLKRRVAETGEQAV